MSRCQADGGAILTLKKQRPPRPLPPQPPMNVCNAQSDTPQKINALETRMAGGGVT